MKLTEQKFRAFIAIDFSAQQRDAASRLIDKIDKKQLITGIRWSKLENLHLTLRFLGDITEAQRQKIVESVANAVVGRDNFQLEFDKLVLFPTAQHPIALVLTPKDSSQLIALQQHIAQVVMDCGIVAETKAFIPHLTLGKIKNNTTSKLESVKVAPICITVKELKLFRSDPGSESSEYSRLDCISW